MTVNLVVYDLDGTLIDSLRTVNSIINEMRLEINKPPIDTERLIPYVSMGGLKLIENALEIDCTSAEQGLFEFRARYLTYTTQEADLYPGVRKTLDALVNEGKYLAICTNKPRNLVDKILAELSLTQYFKCVVAGGDLPTQKPCSENLLRCVKFFNSDVGSSILVGDSAVDQNLANACNVKFAFFRCGYDDGVNPALASVIIENHSDLLEALRNFT